MSGSDPVKSFETLDVQVKALEGDVRDIKTSIASLGAEVRQALANVSHQFAQQQRTPWATIGSVGGVFIAVVGFMVFQTITPMQSDIRDLKGSTLPREEAVFRYGINNQRLNAIETDIRQIQTRRYDEQSKMIEQLQIENRELRRK